MVLRTLVWLSAFLNVTLAIDFIWLMMTDDNFTHSPARGPINTVDIATAMTLWLAIHGGIMIAVAIRDMDEA